MKMLLCVLCLEPLIGFPYLINCLSQRQKVSKIWEKRRERKPSCHPPPSNTLAGEGGGSQGGSSMETLPAENHFNELWAPFSPILLLRPSPSLPNPHSQHKSNSHSEHERSKVQGTEGHPRKLFEEGPHSVAQPRTSPGTWTAWTAIEPDKALGKWQCLGKLASSPASFFWMKTSQHFGCLREPIPLQTDLTSIVKGKLHSATGHARVTG